MPRAADEGQCPLTVLRHLRSIADRFASSWVDLDYCSTINFPCRAPVRLALVERAEPYAYAAVRMKGVM